MKETDATAFALSPSRCPLPGNEINAQLLSEEEEEENEMKSKQNVINHIAMVTDYSMIYERLVNKTASTDPFHLLLTCPINKTKTGK
ncbi:hypothetical protein T03_3654 [Trichinella britovi]|uniref:Uncharacterized protein n=2 Tax=Trichinella TaxID=6333 RepID=A0A0V1D2Y4_TRIBR|nr:hypothetical protein T05_10989 [Trichinella murrelli]KRY55817.1 hypothetical protein T03_3654 [Trichinella britovi]